MGKGTKSQDSGGWKLDLGCASGGSQTPVQKSAAHQENYVKLQQGSQKSNNSGLSRVWGGCGAASSRSECAHVCVRACARVCAHVCACARVHTCVPECMCPCVHRVCVHVCAYVHVHVYNMCASCVRVRVPIVCACVCTHVCVGGSGARRAWNAAQAAAHRVRGKQRDRAPRRRRARSQRQPRHPAPAPSASAASRFRANRAPSKTSQFDFLVFPNFSALQQSCQRLNQNVALGGGEGKLGSAAFASPAARSGGGGARCSGAWGVSQTPARETGPSHELALTAAALSPAPTGASLQPAIRGTQRGWGTAL